MGMTPHPTATNNIVDFLQFFSAKEISKIKDFKPKGMLETLKKSSKTGDLFGAISDL